MADWFLETGVYLLGVVVVPLVGLLLVCWGLWGDRSKGRARCPKCWYDMRGSLPRLECPECGHAPGNVRGLYRTRRGRRRIVVGVLLVLVSSYPLAIAGAWCRDQSSMSRLRKHWGSFTVVRTGPVWLVTRLPEGFARLFDRVDRVILFFSVTDADLAWCGKLRHLRSLRVVGGREVTDLGLKHLEGLARLERISLGGTQVTAAGVAGLSQALPNADIRAHGPSIFMSKVPSTRLHWPPPGDPDPFKRLPAWWSR